MRGRKALKRVFVGKRKCKEVAMSDELKRKAKQSKKVDGGGELS